MHPSFQALLYFRIRACAITTSRRLPVQIARVMKDTMAVAAGLMMDTDKTIGGNTQMPVFRKALDVLRVQLELTKTQGIWATSRCASPARLVNTRATQQARSA